MARILAGILILLSLSAVGLGGLYYSGYFSDHTAPQTIQGDYGLAQALLEEEKATDALMIIDRYTHLPQQQIDIFESEGMDWRELELQALVQSSSIPRLFHLYRRSPQTFDKHESVVISMALLLVQWHRFDEYSDMRRRWIGKESAIKTWFLLDADHLIFQNKMPEARAHLESRTFEGTEDIPRLIRLALANSSDNLPKTWEYLTEAFQLNPKSSEVRSFRAQIFERLDKLRMARFEYSAALLANPESALVRDQLGEFFRRHHDHAHAIATWYSGLGEIQSDLLWLRVIFWERMTLAIQADIDITKTPKGHLEPLALYVHNLDDGTFWDENSFAKLNEKGFYLANRQETYWLQLLDKLQDGREQEALEMIETNRFAKQSWAPHIENGLRQVLSYRLKGEIPLAVEIYPKGFPSYQREPHILFQQLNILSKAGDSEALEKAMPKDLRALLMGDEAFASLLMAGGWREAGLALHRMAVIPDKYPDWVAYVLIQSLVSNRGMEDALASAMRQRSTPLLALIQGELLLAAGKKDEAIPLLESLAKQENALGFRSSLLLSNVYIAEQDWEKAIAQVKENKALAQTLMGKEQLAHIAVLQQKYDLADELYAELEQESFTAKSYLAKRAFDAGNFTRARELTEQLIREQPDLLPLRANLKEIIKQEKAAAEGKAVEVE